MSGVAHPSVWTLITTIEKEDAFCRALIASALLGEPPKKKVKTVYKNLNRALRSLCERRRDNVITVEECLRGAGNRIRFGVQPDVNDI